MLETKRLILKLTNIADLDYIAALRADPEVMCYTTSGVQTRDQVKEWISYSDAYFQKHGLDFFSVFEKEGSMKNTVGNRILISHIKSKLYL